MTKESIPSNLEIRRYILETCQEPVIFRNAIDDWDILNWSLNKWADRIGKKLLPFRVGEMKGTEQPQWEYNCKTEYMTLEDFIGKCNVVENNSLNETCKWWYFDYKHMHQWFLEYPEILKTVNWGRLGFPERGGEKSTLWLGSIGAHTPCHLDTYGCNLIAQVYGRKRWYLFPPNLVDKMAPTRIPYEESSVFSKHNFFYPSSITLKENFIGARVVTLEPGQVLFVPRHWWHYVENLQTAISINTWLPLAADDESRLEESLVRLLVAQLCHTLPHPEHVLNPNEADLPNHPVSDALKLVQMSMERYLQNLAINASETEKLHTVCGGSMANPQEHTCSMENELSNHVTVDFKHSASIVPECPLPAFRELLSQRHQELHLNEANDKDETGTLLHNCINAFCHPDVVARAKNVLLNKATTSSIR